MVRINVTSTRLLKMFHNISYVIFICELLNDVYPLTPALALCMIILHSSVVLSDATSDMPLGF